MNGVEQFTAVAMCPACQSVAIHPFRMPWREPERGDYPASRAWRRISALNAMMSGRWGDPSWAAVIRQCSCGTEWPQA